MKNRDELIDRLKFDEKESQPVSFLFHDVIGGILESDFVNLNSVYLDEMEIAPEQLIPFIP